MHPNSEQLFAKYAAKLFTDGLRVLEVSPDGFPSTYQSQVHNEAITWEYLGLGPPCNAIGLPSCVRHKLAYVSQHEYSYPVDNNTFDIVLSGQVIEHVKRIWLWVPELARICKPGGHVVTICPLSWVFHEQPVDCWRIYPDGMRALYDDAGLCMKHVSCESLDGRETDTIAVGRKPNRQSG